MGLNIGYLTSNTTVSGDEVYTPFYAVEPIIKYIPKEKVIWCPFDENWSAFYQLLKEHGYKVIRSNLKDGQDFFKYEPVEHYDVIISNPPFSKKDKVLKRCYELHKPFMILLPIPSLQSIARVEMFIKYGLQLLSFNKRINYHTNFNFETYRKGNHFASAYFCRNILPNNLIFEELNEYQRPLQKEERE